MESEGASHTITGVNAMGSATAVLEIVILAPMPESIQYPSKTLTCVLDSYCEIGPPMLLGGPCKNGLSTLPCLVSWKSQRMASSPE